MNEQLPMETSAPEKTRGSAKKPFGNPYLSTFCMELSLLLDSGIPAEESVEMLIEDEKDKDVLSALNTVWEALTKGEMLSDALTAAGTFPSYMLDMVKLGEETGRTSTVLASLSRYYDRRENLIRAVRSAVIYPCILAILMLAVIVIIITKVLPVFNGVAEQMGLQLSGAAGFFTGLGMFLSESAVWIALVLVTGPAGSGKSTTLDCMIDAINTTRSGHIITMEDPIEYIHKDKKCIVSQREIKTDTSDYITVVRASLRQAPDVILVGEMRDYETIRSVMTAAETGHLVISTLHSIGAVNTIDRIIGVFPPNQQQQIRVKLSMILRTVISQQLIQTNDGAFCPVFEVMHINNAIHNIIRESKVHQIDTVIASSSTEGMMSMDAGLLALVKAKKISKDTALTCASSPEMLEKCLMMM